MTFWRALIRYGLGVGVTLLSFQAWALDVPPYGGHVNDYVKALSSEESTALENRLREHRARTGEHFAVLIIPSLEQAVLEDYSLKVAEAWKLGQAGKDNGLLLVVVIYDRKMRFEVGYGLEGKFPDAVCNQLIRNVLVPKFKNTKYYEGIDQAFQVLLKISESPPGQALSVSEAAAKVGSVDRGLMDLDGPVWWFVAIFLFGILGLFGFFVLVLDDSMGWILYGFLAIFWGIFPHFLLRTRDALAVFLAYLVLAGLGRAFLQHTRVGKPWAKWLEKLIPQGSPGGEGESSSSSSWRSSSSRSSSSSSSSSGGGGRFGGGGSSGSW